MRRPDGNRLRRLIARDSAIVGIGLASEVDDRYTLFLRCDADVFGGASSHAINAGIRFRR